jgi:hypothetical protein
MDTPNPESGADTAIPIACDLQALGSARTLHEAFVRELFADQHSTDELPDGYAFRFAAADYARVTAFMERERRCCPFFTFRLTLPPGQAPLTLEVTGPDGAKDLLLLLAHAGSQQQAAAGSPIPLHAKE